MTTEFSWRYVFAGETVVVAIILLAAQQAREGARDRAPAQARRTSACCSRSSPSASWSSASSRAASGVDRAARRARDRREEITPFGFSAVPFLILAGLGFLAAFALWEERREREGRDVLLDRSLLKIVPMRAGLTTLMMQQLILLGTFFVLPVYLQVVLGLDAFETGKRLFPMSVTMFIAAMAGPRLAAGLAPEARRADRPVGARRRIGGPARDHRRRAERGRVRARARAVRRRRGPAPLPARERDHVVGRPVQDQRGGRPSGHRAEPRRVARHGPHRRGADRRAHHRLHRRVENNPAVPPPVRERVAGLGEKGIPVVPVDEVEQAALKEGIPRTRPRRSPTTTGTPSCRGSSARSAPSGCSRSCRCGSRGGFRDAR